MICQKIQILGSVIDGGQKWFSFQEDIIHIRIWPFTPPYKKNLILRKIYHNKISFF